MLIRYDAALNIKENLVLEIPKELFQKGEESRITILKKDQKTGKILERTLLIQQKR